MSEPYNTAASRPRVLIWHWGRRGGGPRYTYELARALAQRRDLAVHLSLSRQSEIYPLFASLDCSRHDIDTYTNPAEFLRQTLRLRRLRRQFAAYIRGEKIDLVFCTMDHLWNPAIAGVMSDLNLPYLLTVHDAVRHPGEGNAVRDWLLQRDIGAADGVLALTESVRSAVVAKYRFPRDRTWVAPHGIFAFGDTDFNPRQLEPGRRLRLLFFGRFLPYKGLDLLLDAVDQLRQSGNSVDCEIWGSGNARPYRERLSRLPEIRVENRWIKETEIASVFAKADVCVLPYREASQSGVIATAFACGIPVIVTPLPGLIEQVRHEANALIAPAISAEALAGQIRTLAASPELYRHLSAGALETARTDLNWTNIAGKVAVAIHRLTSIGRRQPGGN